MEFKLKGDSAAGGHAMELVEETAAVLTKPVHEEWPRRDFNSPMLVWLTAVDGKGKQEVVGASAEDAAIAGDEEEHPVDERA